MIQDVLGLPVELAAPFDFSFLARYGTPFCVFDQQQSGNIAFGMQSAQWGKLFVKFAGAPTVNARVAPTPAAEALCLAMPAYQALYAHPALVKLLGCGTVAGGYAAVFRWAEGVNLYPGTRFSPAERYTHADSPLYQLSHQPLIVRLRMLDNVFDFHRYALSKGFMAVDFYDGSLLADFSTGRITVCDIDLYRRMPCRNNRGRMPGSARFLSPEEYELGAPLDGLTLQYTMGALAFAFLADHGSREAGAWMAAAPLYAVAARACAEDRAERYPSYDAFLSDWRETVGKITVY